MGNIRSTYVKTISDRLIEFYPDRFSIDFNKNKESLDGLLRLESKSERNKIAGFIAHNIKKMKKLNTVKITYQNPNLDKRKKGKKRY